MSEQKIEQFWRDATAEDVAGIASTRKPIAARMRDIDNETWVEVLLAGWYIRRSDAMWFDSDGAAWNQCQVYAPQQYWLNKPDPGEGYRLLEKFPDEGVEENDQFFDRDIWLPARLHLQQIHGTWYRRRIEPPTPSESVALAMQMACERFGGFDGVFNGASFSGAFRELAGVNCSLDGYVVATILNGRADVEVLKGGSHYRFLGYVQKIDANCEPVNSPEKLEGSRSKDYIPSGWVKLSDDEPRLASDAYWSQGASEWCLIGEDRINFANRSKWPAIRQAFNQMRTLLVADCCYCLPNGQKIRTTEKGFEVL